MLLLTTTSDVLKLTTSSAEAVDVTVSADDTTTTTNTPLSQETAFSSATTATILSAPAAATQRQIKLITITNKGTAVNNITLKKDNGTAYSISPVVPLYPNESFYYNDFDGFYKTDINGCKVIEGVESQFPCSLRTHEQFTQSNITAPTTINTTAKGVFIGLSDKNATSVTVQWRCTGATTGVTWAEIAILKSPYFARQTGVDVPNPILVGYASIAAEVLATAIYTTTINVAAGQKIEKGDGVYVIFSISSSGALTTIRGTSANSRDDIGASFGTTQSGAGTQPSLSTGNIYWIALNSTPMWIATMIN